MRAAIAYYSKTGNNETLAHAVHQKLASRGIATDLVRIEPVRNVSPALGAVKAALKWTTRLKETHDFTGYDALVMCSPIWAAHMSPAIRELLMTAGGLPGMRVFNMHCCMGDPGRTREEIAEMLEAQGAIVLGSRHICDAELGDPRTLGEFAEMAVSELLGAKAAV